LQPVVSEAADQTRENMQMTIAASEAGQRNACDV
jgi:hypothetical protein